MAGSSYSPYLSKHYDIFISHSGPDSKAKVAVPLKLRLEERGYSVFVDETDAPAGGNAPRNIEQALELCKVAIVLFSKLFWDSIFCVKELELTLELADNQSVVYLPVFMFSTVAEVRNAAHDWKDEATADQVCRPAGIRHKGEILNGRYKTVGQTIDHICKEACALLRDDDVAPADPAVQDLEPREESTGAAFMGKLEMLWSAAAADQPPGLTQISIHLAADMPAAEISLLGIVPRLLSLDEGSTFYTLEEDFHNFMGLGDLKDTLQRQGLAPGSWRLSTGFLGRRVDVELSTGSDGGLAVQRINPSCIPIITEIYLWTAADGDEDRLVIHGNEGFLRAKLQACSMAEAGESAKSEPKPLQRMTFQSNKVQDNLPSLAKRPYTGVYILPQLSRQSAFRIEALLDSTLLQYPGESLDLMSRVQRWAETDAELEAISKKLPVEADWRAAAARAPPPEPFASDVFISYAGYNAEKPFALALRALLQRTGLRVFLDDGSLRPGEFAQQALQAAMKSTNVAVLLFSPEYFNRGATMAELRVLAAQHAQQRVHLLPVFLRMSVEDCKRNIRDILGKEYAGWLPGIRHWGETSSQQPNVSKAETETLQEIVHALSVLLDKEFNAGVRKS